jgi:hypothetical protein
LPSRLPLHRKRMRFSYLQVRSQYAITFKSLPSPKGHLGMPSINLLRTRTGDLVRITVGGQEAVFKRASFGLNQYAVQSTIAWLNAVMVGDMVSLPSQINPHSIITIGWGATTRTLGPIAHARHVRGRATVAEF